MDRKQKLPAFSDSMYFKWHEWVTKEVKENLRFWQAKNHRYQLPHDRYRPHGRIILLFCWSNLILVERAEDPVSLLLPVMDEWWMRTLICPPHHLICLLLRQPGSAYEVTSFTFKMVLPNILYPPTWGYNGIHFYCVPHLSCPNFQDVLLNWHARTHHTHAASAAPG